MSEQLDLTSPIVPATRTTYRVIRMLLDWEAKIIQVVLRGSDGVEILAEWSDSAAVALMTTLNTANFSTISQHKRILQRLVLDGKLPAGSVSGTPE
jgi:hypothetical protein